jgi:hypothetical protein
MTSPLAQTLAPAYGAPPGYRPGTVAPTEVGQITQNSAQDAYNTYAAQLGQQNALWGGLAGIGAAGLLGGPNIYKLINGANTNGTSAPLDFGYAQYSNGVPQGITGVAPFADSPAAAAPLSTPAASVPYGFAPAAPLSTPAAPLGSTSLLDGGTQTAALTPSVFDTGAAPISGLFAPTAGATADASAAFAPGATITSDLAAAAPVVADASATAPAAGLGLADLISLLFG